MYTCYNTFFMFVAFFIFNKLKHTLIQTNLGKNLPLPFVVPAMQISIEKTLGVNSTKIPKPMTIKFWWNW